MNLPALTWKSDGTLVESLPFRDTLASQNAQTSTYTNALKAALAGSDIRIPPQLVDLYSETLGVKAGSDAGKAIVVAGEKYDVALIDMLGKTTLGLSGERVGGSFPNQAVLPIDVSGVFGIHTNPHIDTTPLGPRIDTGVMRLNLVAPVSGIHGEGVHSPNVFISTVLDRAGGMVPLLPELVRVLSGDLYPDGGFIARHMPNQDTLTAAVDYIAYQVMATQQVDKGHDPIITHLYPNLAAGVDLFGSRINGAIEAALRGDVSTQPSSETTNVIQNMLAGHDDAGKVGTSRTDVDAWPTFL